jgi:hypothetical protein
MNEKYIELTKYPYVQKILQLIPPPASTLYKVTDQSFLEVEKQYKIVFPNDYKEILSIYGSGTFCDTLYIASPFGTNSLFDSHFKRIEFYHTMLKGFPVQEDKPRFPIFPEPGGLLEIGGDDNANVLMWKIDYTHNTWPLYFFDDYMLDETVYCMPISEFLFKWIIGEIRPACLEGTLHENESIIPYERIPLFRPDKSKSD